jgi:hypothetical protein
MPYLYDQNGSRWLRLTSLTTKQIRDLTSWETCLNSTKLINLNEQNAKQLFGKMARLKSIPNRAKLYRLLHGDVYCGARTYRWGLTDSDRCIRCFGEETIRHLLLECPYTREIWSRLGVAHNRPEDIINGDLTIGELEIRAELITAIVFRKRTLPPEVLLRTTIELYDKGISRVRKTQQLAMAIYARYQITRQWCG